ncbi:hypothetical protein B0H13DRAFT_2456420 [Mycena leptocephala]|nr:hypothetical protein B0H13DRAFT_2456420 [Mycena leptocephala]
MEEPCVTEFATVASHITKMLPGLEADRARVADLEAQISHLVHSLFAWRKEKMLAQKRLDSYKYPVLTLPNEIVSEIFIHFLPAYPEYPPLTGLLSPTLLTHICRKWQEIVLGTPALWSAISVYKNIPSEKTMWLKFLQWWSLTVHAESTWTFTSLHPIFVSLMARCLYCDT